jgi:16S rRNA G527 N7-methylase RsmG
LNDRRDFAAWFEQAHPQRQDRLSTLLAFGDELLGVNRGLALVSRGDEAVFWMRHVRECLTPGLVEAVAPAGRLLDVGSGNGLPGFVLAALLPNLEVTLLEPRHKKAGFLDRMKLLLGVANARVDEASLEALSLRPTLNYPAVVSRALRWTPRRVAELELVAGPEAVLYRFGPPRPEGRDIPLADAGDRVIQCLPRATWAEDLAEA